MSRDRRDHPQPQGPWIYRLTWWVAYIALHLFYRRIDSVNAHYLPAAGPSVLAANHPNYIIDALAIAVQTRRQIHFVAKGPLLDRYPLLSRFLRAIGVVPVFRAQDLPPRDRSGRARQNRLAFAHCSDLLAENGAICVFAEGESHAEPRVRDLRTGAARIVLEAERSRNYRLGVTVVPVGLYFPEEDRYFSDGVVIYGPPLDTTPFRAQHKTDPNGAVHALTEALQEELQALTLHLPDLDWAEFVEQMRDLIEAWPREPTAAQARLRLCQELAWACERFRQEQPAEADRFRRDVAVLWSRADAWRLHALPEADTTARRTGMVQRLRDALALPFAAAGFVYNAPPYLTVRLWSAYFVRSKEKRAFVKFLVAVPAFLSWYAVVTRRLTRQWRAAGLALWLVGPTTGLLALRMRVHRRRWLDAWRPLDSAQDVRLAAEIAAEREELLARFAPWRAAYRAQRAGAATPQEPTQVP